MFIDTFLAGTSQNCLKHMIRVTVSVKLCQHIEIRRIFFTGNEVDTENCGYNILYLLHVHKR